jgi:chromosome segregation ATPase
VKARETSLAHAEQKIKSLTDRVDQLEHDARAYRARSVKRIEELNETIQRERVELAVAQGALETTRRDYVPAATRTCGRTHGAADRFPCRGDFRRIDRTAEIQERQERRARRREDGREGGRFLGRADIPTVSGR